MQKFVLTTLFEYPNCDNVEFNYNFYDHKFIQNYINIIIIIIKN